MKNRFYKLIIIYMMVFMIFLPLNVLGASSVTIDINTLDDLTKEELDGRTLGVWKINPKFIDPSMDKTKIALIFDSLTDEELDKQLENPSYKWILNLREDDDYKVTINSLGSGFYYVREIGGKSRTRYPLPAVFSPDETNLVRLKWAKRIPTLPPDVPPGTPPPETPPEVPPYTPPDEPPIPPLPPNTVELIKVDESGNLLKGAKFTLHYLDGERVKTKGNSYDKEGSEEVFETDKEGKIRISNIAEGSYFFREIEAPVGYKILEEDTYFTIIGEESKVVRVENIKKKGSILFYKVDESGSNPLAGAEFVVTKIVDGSHVRLKDASGKDLVLVSGNDGRFYISNLDYGTYYIWETKAPEGYNLLKNSLEFEINDDSFDKTLVIKNNKKPPIPSTGDVTLIVLVVAGAIMIFMGRYLIKDND